MPPDSFAHEVASLAQTKAVKARHKRAERRKQSTLQMRQTPQVDGPHDAASTMTGSPTQRRGRDGEDRAERYLRTLGLTVLERNLRCKMGEIDLVVRDHNTLVFVEVRLRRSTRYGGGAASVNRYKQTRLIRAARLFLPLLAARYFRGKTPPCRFDVISIDGEGLRWLRHAFSHEGR